MSEIRADCSKHRVRPERPVIAQIVSARDTGSHHRSTRHDAWSPANAIAPRHGPQRWSTGDTSLGVRRDVQVRQSQRSTVPTSPAAGTADAENEMLTYECVALEIAEAD